MGSDETPQGFENRQLNKANYGGADLIFGQQCSFGGGKVDVKYLQLRRQRRTSVNICKREREGGGG